MRPISECVFYQIQLRAFTPEGTLNTARQLLPHLADMGVDVLFLCAIAKADADPNRSHWSKRALTSGFENPYNPYRTLDYESIDPEYGTDDDLRAFVQEVHRLGMRLLLDIVYYHCGPSCALTREHPEFCKRLENGEIDRGEFNMIRFDFNCPGVRSYFTRNMCDIVERFNVDGYRCDCGDLIPADFWEEAVTEVKKRKPDLVMLNEGHNESHQRQAFDVDYGMTWGDKLVSLVKDGTVTAAQIAQGMEKVSRGSLPRCVGLRGLENHDFANDAKDERAERVLPREAIEAAMVVNFTLDGVPYLYSGAEVADSRRHSIFSNRFYGGREWVDWSNALKPLGQERMALVKRLSALRHGEAALTHGEIAFAHDAPEGVIAFERRLGERRVWVCANLTSQPTAVAAPCTLEKAEVLLSREAARDCAALHLGPFGFFAAAL